jgi:hypothetical protein
MENVKDIFLDCDYHRQMMKDLDKENLFKTKRNSMSNLNKSNLVDKEEDMRTLLLEEYLQEMCDYN